MSVAEAEEESVVDGRHNRSADSASRDEMLHELTLIAHWEAAVITPNPLRHVRNAGFPLYMLQSIERRPLWKFAVDTEHHLYAILRQSGDLEIRSLDAAAVGSSESHSLIAHAKLGTDANSDWSGLLWSESRALLLVWRSVPVIDVLDATAAFCYSIPLEGDMNVEFDTMLAVSCCRSVAVTDNSKWHDRLYTLQYCGTLRCFNVGRLCGFHAIFQVELHQSVHACFEFTPSMCLNVQDNLLYVSVQCAQLKDTQWPAQVTAHSMGLLQLRLTDNEPYVQLTPVSQQNIQMLGSEQSLFARAMSLLPMFTVGYTAIVSIEMNDQTDRIACVTSQGDLLVFEVPSLRLVLALAAFMELLVLKEDGSVSVVSTQIDGAQDLVQAVVDELRQDQLNALTLTHTTALLAPNNGLCYLFESIGQSGTLDTVSHEGKLRLVTRIVAGTAYGWCKLLLAAAFGRALQEITVASPHALATRHTLFRLTELRLTTPEEMFRKMLDSGRYSDALSLASSYGLCADAVHKHKWTNNTHNMNSALITDSLCAVSDSAWVLNECLVHIPHSAQLCHQLLQSGLALTTQLLTQSPVQSDQYRMYAHAHIRLLHYTNRLGDCEALAALGVSGKGNAGTGCATVQMYKQMRSKALLDVAVVLAQDGRFDELLVLYARHGRRLQADWLAVLSCVSSVVPINQYSSLLPVMMNGHGVLCEALSDSAVEQCIDYVQSDVIVSKHSFKQSFATELAIYSDSNLYELQPELTQFIWSTESNTLMSAWFEWRARSIELQTALPHLFVKFLTAAVHRGFLELSALLRDAEQFECFVYSTGDVSIGFDTFIQTDCSLIVTAYMQDVTSVGTDRVLRRLQQQVLPYIEHSAAMHRCTAHDVLHVFILAQCTHNLHLYTAILTLHTNTQGQVFQGATQFTAQHWLGLLQACARACELQGARLADSLHKALQLLPADCDQVQVQALESHVDVLQVFASYGLSLTLTQIEQAQTSTTEAQVLMQTLIRQAPQASWTLLDWQHLQRTVCVLCTKHIQVLSVCSAVRMLVGALLASHQSHTIRYAIHFVTLDPTMDEHESGSDEWMLPYAVSVSALVQACMEYIDEASNAHDPVLQWAHVCIQLYTDTKQTLPSELLQLHNTLLALPLLHDLGLNELPCRVRLMHDKCVSVAGRKNYRKTRELLKVAKLLVCEPDCDIHDQVLLLCAKAALLIPDHSTALLHCTQLIHARAVRAWSVCHQLCLALGNKNMSSMPTEQLQQVLELWSFVCLCCSPELLGDALTAIMHIKQYMNKTVLSECALCNTSFAAWNAVQRTEPVQPDVVYVIDPNQYINIEHSAHTLHNEQHSALTIRSLMLNTTVTNRTLVDLHFAHPERVPQSAVVQWSRCSTCVSVSAVLCMLLTHADTDCSIDTLKQCLADPRVVQYISALLCCRQVLEVPLSELSHIQPSTLIRAVINHKWTTPVDNVWLKALHSTKQQQVIGTQAQQVLALFPDVDAERFERDAMYRSDTIEGLALTHDSQAFGMAVQLAQWHSIDTWHMYMTNLTYLLTDAQLPCASALRCIQRHHLIEHLRSDRVQLCKGLQSSVWPLLLGTDLPQLLLYYTVLHKAGTGLPEASAAQKHRMNIRKLQKLNIKVDYKQLMSSAVSVEHKATLIQLLNTDMSTQSLLIHMATDNQAEEEQELVSVRLQQLIDSDVPLSEAVELLNILHDMPLIMFIESLQLTEMLAEDRVHIECTLHEHLLANTDRLPLANAKYLKRFAGSVSKVKGSKTDVAKHTTTQHNLKSTIKLEAKQEHETERTSFTATAQRHTTEDDPVHYEQAKHSDSASPAAKPSSFFGSFDYGNVFSSLTGSATKPTGTEQQKTENKLHAATSHGNYKPSQSQAHTQSSSVSRDPVPDPPSTLLHRRRK